MKTRRSGFTLIELLIVVAIIAILAAIAVPNFLEAQVRSKVSRVKSDMRTLATAIEAYAVDNNSPPPSAGEAGHPPIVVRGIIGTGVLGPALSTPISYITSSMIQDPFVDRDYTSNPDETFYSYHTYIYRWPKYKPNPRPDTDGWGASNEGNTMTGLIFKDLYGNWRLISNGPDRNYWNKLPKGTPASIGLPYDPTNGTTSPGNVIRSHKESNQTTWLMVGGQ